MLHFLKEHLLCSNCAYYAQRFTWCSSFFSVKTWQSSVSASHSRFSDWSSNRASSFSRLYVAVGSLESCFRMSSDCGEARSLLGRDDTAELVAWELVQVSLPSLGLVLVAVVNRHVVRCVRAPPRNDVIFSQNLPVMLSLCLMLLCNYYAHFSATIISAPLDWMPVFWDGNALNSSMCSLRFWFLSCGCLLQYWSPCCLRPLVVCSSAIITCVTLCN